MKILQGFVAPYAIGHGMTVGFGPGGSTAPSVWSLLLEDHAAARQRFRAKAAPAADRWAPGPEPMIATCSIPSATTIPCRIWLDTAYCRRIGDIFLLPTLVWKLDQPRRLDSAGCYRTVRFACRGGHPSSKGVVRPTRSQPAASYHQAGGVPTRVADTHHRHRSRRLFLITTTSTTIFFVMSRRSL